MWFVPFIYRGVLSNYLKNIFLINKIYMSYRPLLFYLENKKLNHLLGCFCSLNRNNFIFLLISFIYKVKIFIQKIKYLIKLNWNIKFKKINRPNPRLIFEKWPQISNIIGVMPKIKELEKMTPNTSVIDADNLAISILGWKR